MKTLSDKIVLVRVEFGQSDELFDRTKCAGQMIHIDYVQEFIKNINGLINYILIDKQEISAIKDGIRKLTGDKLNV